MSFIFVSNDARERDLIKARHIYHQKRSSQAKDSGAYPGINICSILGRHANWFRFLLLLFLFSCCCLVVCAKYLVQQLSRKYTEKTHGLPQAAFGSGTALSGGINFTEERTKSKRDREKREAENRRKENKKKPSKNAPIAINFDQLPSWVW